MSTLLRWVAWYEPRFLPDSRPLILEPSGRFVTDSQGRRVAEMLQPGDSPAEQEAISAAESRPRKP